MKKPRSVTGGAALAALMALRLAGCSNSTTTVDDAGQDAGPDAGPDGGDASQPDAGSNYFDAGPPIADCQMHTADGTPVQHIIHIMFDNVHWRRDNPNVPSDLEQIPSLKSFLERNGTVLLNHHTPLIAHTATDLITSLTGVYGDRHGVPISNAYDFYDNGTIGSQTSFTYWTSPVDAYTNMLAQNGKTAPAPWVPYTRAGCNYGATASANVTLESTADIATVFGANSSEAGESSDQATSDFIGMSIHCAQGSAICSGANGGVADLLPDEPGGYAGYNGLFGHKFIAPYIADGGTLNDLDGNPIDGFPGFTYISASQSLAYMAGMLEHGVQVTQAYISDAHDNKGGGTFGPGEAGYVAQLQSYDEAFSKFFARLAADGITPANSLFIVNADENDHFVGGPPSPAGCDGVTTPCTYALLGEQDVNLQGYLVQAGTTTDFQIHDDSCPEVYLDNQPPPTDPTLRAFGRATMALTLKDPVTGVTGPMMNYAADPVEMQLLHLITADPARTPSLAFFGNPDYYIEATGPTCNFSHPCIAGDDGYAWNHGDVSPDINLTWAAMVGPGIAKSGDDYDVWSDHTDLRPTILATAGLVDDYVHQGRVLTEIMTPGARPPAVASQEVLMEALGEVYKQINSPTGQLSLDSLVVSTAAVSSGSDSTDTTYTAYEAQIAGWTTTRNALASQIEAVLDGADFQGQGPDVATIATLINQGEQLLGEVHQAAQAAKPGP